MSPRIEADFSQISSSFQPVEAGPYICVLAKVTGNKTSTGKDQIEFELKIDDPSFPQYNGRPLFDRVVLQKNDGTANGMSYGRIKQYAEAILGEEAANNPHGYDTEEFLGSQVVAVVSQESYDYIPAGGTEADRKKGISNKIDRIMAVG